MPTITVTRQIDAPAGVVFHAVADPMRFGEAIGGVTKVEITHSASGAGTRYRQSRFVNGRQSTMDFEVTEYVENKRIRIVNNTHGTLWDSVFSVAPSAGTTTLTMRMDATATRLVAKMLLPIVCKIITKAVEADIDAVKAFCERETAGRPGS